MARTKKETIKIFKIVSLGEELCPEDISRILKEEITLNSKKPDIFFTVTECAVDDAMHN